MNRQRLNKAVSTRWGSNPHEGGANPPALTNDYVSEIKSGTQTKLIPEPLSRENLVYQGILNTQQGSTIKSYVDRRDKIRHNLILNGA